MLTLRPSAERGHTRIDWLDSYHSFSFGDYRDPRHHHFSDLRVINEDFVRPGKGFEPHSHQDMEIITVVLEGGLAHQDSLDNGSVIRAGDVQRMTAGWGITHSEFNASDTMPVHFLQVWIVPEKRGLTPGYEQATFPDEARRNRLCLIASPDGVEESLTVHQDVYLFTAVLDAGEALTYTPRSVPPRKTWLQVTGGRLLLDGLPGGSGPTHAPNTLVAGDGLGLDRGIAQGVTLTLRAELPDTAFLLFDLRGES